MTYRKQYPNNHSERNRPYWISTMLNTIPNHTLLTTTNLFSYYTHNKNYSYYRNRLQKCIDTEELILNRFESYYINRLDIRLKQSIRINDKDHRNTLNYLKQTLTHFYNCIRGNGLHDRLLATLVSFEKGTERKRWHIHMYCFWRGDMIEGEHDRCLLELKRFMENLDNNIDCWCVYDSDKTLSIGRVTSNNKKKRNQCRCLLSYLCKIKLPVDLGWDINTYIEDWTEMMCWLTKEQCGEEISMHLRTYWSRVRRDNLTPLPLIRNYPRLRGSDQVKEGYTLAKIALSQIRRDRTVYTRKQSKKDEIAAIEQWENDIPVNDFATLF